MGYQNKSKQFVMQKGYSLVELLLAMGIFSVMITALFTGFIATREGKPQQERRFEAVTLFQESVEALRVIREQGWDSITTNGIYHPQQTSTSWIIVPGVQTIDPELGLTRSLEIGDAYRNSSGEIVTSGGTLDPSTKAITITISWDQPLVSSFSRTIYLTRYLDNLAFIHTTAEDFEQPGHELENTVVLANPSPEDLDNGLIRLSPLGTGRGDWCSPNPNFAQFNLSGQAEASGVMAFYNSSENRSEVFSSTGKNASGNPLSYVRVSNSYPPIPTLGGIFSSQPQIKVNRVFGIPGFAYLTTTRPGQEVISVNLSNMSQVGYFDAPGSVDGQSVFIKDGIGYLTQGSNLRIFDASSPNGERSLMSSISLSGLGRKVQVVGNYAYISIDSTTNQLQIIDVSNPSSPGSPKNFTVNGLQGKSLFVSENGERVYLVTALSASHDEFFIINTADPNKNNLSVISSRNTGNMNPNAVAVVLSGNRALLVGEGGNEYQVWSIASESNPTLCGSLGSLGGVFDIATIVQDNGDAYAFITTGQAESELKIIEGGPGGAYSTTGTYESAVFDANSTTAFNRISHTADVPTQTTLRFQVAAAQAIDGSCESVDFTFVGPDGTINTYFDHEQSIPFKISGSGYRNPAQCFKYKAFFNTNDLLVTPLLEDVTVNYSP